MTYMYKSNDADVCDTDNDSSDSDTALCKCNTNVVNDCTLCEKVKQKNKPFLLESCVQHRECSPIVARSNSTNCSDCKQHLQFCCKEFGTCTSEQTPVGVNQFFKPTEGTHKDGTNIGKLNPRLNPIEKRRKQYDLKLFSLEEELRSGERRLLCDCPIKFHGDCQITIHKDTCQYWTENSKNSYNKSDALKTTDKTKLSFLRSEWIPTESSSACECVAESNDSSCQKSSDVGRKDGEKVQKVPQNVHAGKHNMHRRVCSGTDSHNMKSKRKRLKGKYPPYLEMRETLHSSEDSDPCCSRRYSKQRHRNNRRKSESSQEKSTKDQSESTEATLSTDDKSTQSCDFLPGLRYAIPFLSEKLKTSLFTRLQSCSGAGTQVGDSLPEASPLLSNNTEELHRPEEKSLNNSQREHSDGHLELGEDSPHYFSSFKSCSDSMTTSDWNLSPAGSSLFDCGSSNQQSETEIQAFECNNTAVPCFCECVDKIQECNDKERRDNCTCNDCGINTTTKCNFDDSASVCNNVQNETVEGSYREESELYQSSDFGGDKELRGANCKGAEEGATCKIDGEVPDSRSTNLEESGLSLSFDWPRYAGMMSPESETERPQGAEGGMPRSISDLLTDLERINLIDSFLSDPEDNGDDCKSTKSSDSFLKNASAVCSSSENGEADDEFECDCDHCHLERSRSLNPSEGHQQGEDDIYAIPDFHFDHNTDHIFSLPSLLGTDQNRQDRIEDSENEDTVFSMLPSEPLEEFVYDIRREIEEGFERVILQMLQLHPELMNDSAPPPASTEVVDNLPMTPVSQDIIDTHENCPVCLGLYNLEETIATLPCDHLFHHQCIKAWLNKSGTCPVCRRLL